MTAIDLLHDLRRRGILLERRGDRIRYYPADALSEAELAVLRAQRAEVLRALQDERRRQYADLTEDIGGAEDREALRWLTDRDDGATLAALLALDRQCAELARQGADDDVFRQAVEAFVDRVRRMRDAYRRERTA